MRAIPTECFGVLVVLNISCLVKAIYSVAALEKGRKEAGRTGYRGYVVALVKWLHGYFSYYSSEENGLMWTKLAEKLTSVQWFDCCLSRIGR